MQLFALGSRALCTVSVAALVAAFGSPARAGEVGDSAHPTVGLGAAAGLGATDSYGSAEGPGGEPNPSVPYDLDFLRKDDGQNAIPISEFPGKSMQRIVSVNGVEYGLSETGVYNDTVYIASNLASVAGLECGEFFVSNGISICAIPARDFSTEGDRLFIEYEETKKGASDTIEAAPELTPRNAAVLNYDTTLVVNPDGAVSLFGSLQPGLRLKENAFDVQASFFQPINTVEGQTRTGGQFTFSSFAYRREWFEQRLRVLAGRTSAPARGLMGGEQFDGVSLERFNSDDVGSVPSSGLRPITGFAEGPGIVQYRVGDKVYKQIPIREGRYELPGNFLTGAPRGGRLEFVGLDGVARELSKPTDINVQYALYRKGDYSFDMQAGRLQSIGGDRLFGSMGGRYGLTRDITIDLGVSATDKAFAIGGSLSTRLPGNLGGLSFAGATSRSWSGRQTAFASTADITYYNRFGAVSFDVSHRQYFKGGYRGLDNAVSLSASSGIIQNTRVALGLPLPLPGNDLSLRLIAERSSYRDVPFENRSLQVDLSRGFGKLGSVSFAGRIGRDQLGQNYSTMLVNWVLPFGGRNGISLNTVRNKSGRGGAEYRYGATFWGSSGGSYGLGSDYQDFCGCRP